MKQLQYLDQLAFHLYSYVRMVIYMCQYIKEQDLFHFTILFLGFSTECYVIQHLS